MVRSYVGPSIAGPLMPGEYRTLPNDRYRICCAGCGELFEVASIEGDNPVPPHYCDRSQIEGE